jgi:predicted Zn-dependent peptidase
MSPLILLLACVHKPAAAPEVTTVPVPTVAADPIDTRPAIGSDAAFTPPIPGVSALSNGESLWVVPQPALPLVTVVLQVAGGSALDPKGKEGVAALSDRMLQQGAGSRDATTFAETVERLGIQLSVDTGASGSRITMSMRRSNLEAGLDLMADMVLRPLWGAKDFKREQKLAIGDLKQSLDELPVVARRVGMAEWFGLSHPYGHPVEGTVKGLGAASLKDLQAYHTTAWNAAGAGFTAVGDVDAATLSPLLDARFGAWKGTKAARVDVPAAPAHDKTEWILVDKPGSAQTMFYVMFPGVAMDDATLPPLRTSAIALGGTFTSRLNHLLREVRGYTYGVRATAEAMRGAGIVTIGTRIVGDKTALAMNDLVAELDKAKAGIDAEELTKARGAFKTQKVEAMETRSGMAGTFASYQALGLGPDALGRDLTGMQAVGLDQVTTAMAHFDRGHAVFLLVGDRAKIEKPLLDAGYGPFVVKPEL